MSVTKKPSRCMHPNCESCPYPECQYDRLDAADYQDNAIDSLLFPESKERASAKNRANRYAEKHREEIRERSLKYYHEHREECNARARQWQRENKDRVAAMKRERWARAPEKYRKKQMDYRKKIRDGLPHCDECEDCILVRKDKGEGYRRLCTAEM